MEKTGCKIICGAPMTLAVKGLMVMMMVLSRIKRIKHNMLYVIGVYLGDISGTIYSILDLNVSGPRICCFCFLFVCVFLTPSAIAVLN